MEQVPYLIAFFFVGAVSACSLWPLRDFLAARRGLPRTQTPAIEKILVPLGMGTVSAVAFAFIGLSLEIVYFLVLLFCSALIAMMDIRYRIIPNALIGALIASRIIFGILGTPDISWVSSLVGFAVCFVIFMLPSLFGKKVGAGDVKLAAAMGFCVGLSGSLVATILMGVFVLGYAMATRYMPMLSAYRKYIPMAPFIGAGLVLVAMMGCFPNLLSI